MKLTKSTDFALRLIIHLANCEHQQTMPKLAKDLEIPYNNLSKLVQSLAKAQIVRTQQGKNGGVSLDRPASDISLKNVIDVIDGPTLLSDCQTSTATCSFTSTCQLKSTFADIQSQIDQLFDNVKIEKFVTH